ncbi:hypothetical protein SK128_024893, partial [Halocaridina rubra]
FNHGFLTATFSGLGEVGFAVAARQEKERLRKDLAVTKQKEISRNKRRRITEEEAKKTREEGTTYEAGGL